MRLLGKALTFDDVLLVPAYSQVLPKDTSLVTQFSRNIQLNMPLVSAAMDTVTEARLAIAIAPWLSHKPAQKWQKQSNSARACEKMEKEHSWLGSLNLAISFGIALSGKSPTLSHPDKSRPLE